MIKVDHTELNGDQIQNLKRMLINDLTANTLLIRIVQVMLGKNEEKKGVTEDDAKEAIIDQAECEFAGLTEGKYYSYHAFVDEACYRIINAKKGSGKKGGNTPGGRENSEIYLDFKENMQAVYGDKTLHHIQPLEERKEKYDPANSSGMTIGEYEWAKDNLVLGPLNTDRIYDPGSYLDIEAEDIKKEFTKKPEHQILDVKKTDSNALISEETKEHHMKTKMLQMLYEKCIDHFRSSSKQVYKSTKERLSAIINLLLKVIPRIEVIETEHKECLDDLKTCQKNIVGISNTGKYDTLGEALKNLANALLNYGRKLDWKEMKEKGLVEGDYVENTAFRFDVIDKYKSRESK
ncbi:hypothetical protein [[Clostridium] polysaccharolyticum]|uniref:hypothetical protein n=1 Tax=[Clostridium] polysaccharolyticum TaxID=29364 RepID=UPI00115F912C|nr:hypothetical protein [[Clostridium] polysaccharolyticum]